MKNVEINNVSIAYRDAGSGAPLVLLHAFPLNQSFWDDQVAAFAPSFRVITLDWRGFGESGLGETPSSMDVFSEDLSALLDFLQIEKVTLCGVSMGGYAAFSFLRKYPHRVSALVLADTRSTSDTEEARANRLKMAALAREQGSPIIADQMIPKLLGAGTLANNPAVAARVRAMIEANSGEGIARALLGMAERRDSTPLLPGIKCKTLVIVGEDDTLTPPKDSEAMATAIPGARLVIIPGVGHLSNIENPSEFNRVLGEFLSTL
ncbi:MAG: alpha/beta fold hydrolase [Acidobacteriota bacterium]